jgi:uncharacterized protein YndB with AHSA1/START domain/DNA-binding transcriptional ArsR family regulator
MPNLDTTFSALADPTRRAILARLALGERTVMELAEPFAMTQPAISRHLKVLEGAGLIVRRVDGTKRPCRLASAGIAEIDQWLAMLRGALAKNYDRLDEVLADDEARRVKGQAMSKMTLKTEGDRHVVVTRHFAASPEAVYRAHTEPGLIQKWLLGPDGWTMPVCVSEARPGGKIRYEWTDGKGGRFHLTGEYVELTPFSRIVHVERMHLPDPTPDNHVETLFQPDGAGTLMTMRMTLPDAETRAAMLATGMEHGMEASYVRLESMLEERAP